MRKPVDFTFGGKSYSATVTIGHAVDIEAATGRGVLALAAPLGAFEARITDVLAIINVALRREGVVLSTEKLQDALMVEGIVTGQVTALRILNALFVKPDDTADEKTPKKGKAASGPLDRPTTP